MSEKCLITRMDLSIYILIDSNSNKEKSRMLLIFLKSNGGLGISQCVPCFRMLGEKKFYLKLSDYKVKVFLINHCCTPYCP